MRTKLSVVLLSVMFTLTLIVSGAVAVDNMVANPNFEVDTEGWSIGADWASLYIDGPGIVGNAVCAQIDSVGENAWEPEIHSPPFPLDLGTTYTMDFWAKTEPGLTRELVIKFEQLDIWGGPSGPVTITDQWEHHHFTGESDFQSPPDSVIHIQFEFTLEDVWFSGFRVYEGEYVEPELAPVNPVDRLATAWGHIKSE